MYAGRENPISKKCVDKRRLSPAELSDNYNPELLFVEFP
jgi:hypothetical protein